MRYIGNNGEEIELTKEAEEFLEGINVTEHCRMSDTIFHDVLEISENGDISIGTYSQNSWTPGWTQIYAFPNDQDYANTGDCENVDDFVENEEILFEDWKTEHFEED